MNLIDLSVKKFTNNTNLLHNTNFEYIDRSTTVSLIYKILDLLHDMDDNTSYLQQESNRFLGKCAINNYVNDIAT